MEHGEAQLPSSQLSSAPSWGIWSSACTPLLYAQDRSAEVRLPSPQESTGGDRVRKLFFFFFFTEHDLDSGGVYVCANEKPFLSSGHEGPVRV